MHFNAALPWFTIHALSVYHNAFALGVGLPMLDPTVVEPRTGVIDTGRTLPHRRMVAARPNSDLEARNGGSRGFLRHDHVLHFIEDDLMQAQMPIRDSQTPFAAHVHLSSALPTLLLEDSDSHLRHILCRESTIEIEFYDHAAASVAWDEVRTRPKIVVITSHLGCNDDGARKPYLVSKVEMRDRVLILSVASTSWGESFHSIDVDFGSQVENIHLNRHDQLRRRADPTTTTATASASSSSVAFPLPPSTSPTSTSVHEASIDKSWTDTAILPPDFPGVDSGSLHGPFVPHGITIACKQCSLQGNVDMSHGMFTLTSGSGNTTESVKDFYEEGFVELAVNGFAAHIELESTVIASESLYLYTAPFPDIAIPGFSIPGIATVGPVLRPRVTFGVQVATELNFTYGFDMSIPDNSSVIIDIKSPTNSTVSGFQHSKISPIPFQSSLDNLNLTVSAAFNPQLLLTISVLDNDGSINAGAFLDLPNVQATIAQVNHVDSSCNPANGTGTGSNFIFNSLTNIVPSVDLDVGVLANAQLKAGAFEVEDAAVYTAWSTSYPLPTVCLNYDAAKKTYTTSTPGSKSGASSLGRSGSLLAGSFPLYIFCVVLFGLL